MTLFGVARPVEYGVPHKYHRTMGQGLPQDGDGGRYRAVHAFEYTGVVLGRHYGGGIDEY
jgi:hypothetical protein